MNTGSVGRPKDGDPRAGYVILTVTEPGVVVDFIRVQYDIEDAARGILASDLPDELGTGANRVISLARSGSRSSCPCRPSTCPIQTHLQSGLANGPQLNCAGSNSRPSNGALSRMR